ncbi:hypothetical protein PENTCL1PPCAC_12506 [Pristionchus entomophagus]|uniref:Dehydrogenase n=1 Tax=Pristionchus entomophagus TaxID=358040 RepID=A0AAV5T493_9BILA|nr:hypothetical protein PENTCL1PPCAC_12506 [Pristionchus entomophagus]
MHEYMEELLQGLIVLVRVLLSIVVASVKAILPRGILPRKNVRGEICLITGAGSGIGRLMALEFAKLGCTMVLWDVNTAGNEETKAMVEKTGATIVHHPTSKVHAYTVDLSKRKQINETAERVKKEVGTVDILINNAGVVTGKTLLESPDEMIERTMAVNATACLYTTKNFLAPMIERNHGHIVTVASILGKLGAPGVVDYCASKYAAVGYHDSLAAELYKLKADGIKTTLVMPYLILTGMFDGTENKSRIISNLEPQYVVDCVMEAVLTNKEELIMPKILYGVALQHFLPTEARHIVAEYLGQYEAMDTFKGRTLANR